MKDKPQVLFVSHGGGPMPLLGEPGHQEMVELLQSVASKIPKPSAILVISAHWEATNASITASAAPPLIYDYYGFPPQAYAVQYPCKGQPILAKQVQAVLTKAGIPANLDEKRGFDHGLFVPLSIMYPQADIPCVQLSLLSNLDPAQHLKIGRALQGLDYENLLVLGSGFSFHNLQAFFAQPSSDLQTKNAAFEQWLQHTCSSTALDENQRTALFLNWTQAPAARFCHPREEHLLPLHVCYGLAGRACSQAFSLSILNKQASMFYW